MKDKELVDELKHNILESIVAHGGCSWAVGRLKKLIAALEANPPLEALVLAEVDDLIYTFRNSGMSRIWVHFPAPPGVSEGSEIPVTVTIRGKPVEI